MSPAKALFQQPKVINGIFFSRARTCLIVRILKPITDSNHLYIYIFINRINEIGSDTQYVLYIRCSHRYAPKRVQRYEKKKMRYTNKNFIFLA